MEEQVKEVLKDQKGRYVVRDENKVSSFRVATVEEAKLWMLKRLREENNKS